MDSEEEEEEESLFLLLASVTLSSLFSDRLMFLFLFWLIELVTVFCFSLLVFGTFHLLLLSSSVTTVVGFWWRSGVGLTAPSLACFWPGIF